MARIEDEIVAIDGCFAQMGEDVDFIGDIVFPDIPVLTYRWSKSDAIRNLSPGELLRRGWLAMQELGLIHIRRRGRHLRGDTNTGQRVKMTVLDCGGESMYWVMTAGMPGTRQQAKVVNRRIAERIEMPDLCRAVAVASASCAGDLKAENSWTVVDHDPDPA